MATTCNGSPTTMFSESDIDQAIVNTMIDRTLATSGNDVQLEFHHEGIQESASNDVFSTYKHRDIVKGCKAHPGNIVEAALLAALDLPKEHYPICDSLPEDVITRGILSSLQLEGIIHACQRHLIIMPSGQRSGFFIGDGAGVGKGRQIAGIIFDNICRGRTRHIWFTISADLIVDSRRDLTDIGCYSNVIDGCQQLDRETRVLGLPAGLKEGIVFSTYATLVSSAQTGGKFSSAKRSRLQQLIDWCGGPTFDGCLIFDECHKAKNFVPNKEQASTKVSLAVTEIQRLLPKARVVYCSATGVSDVKNMAFMERMGLWGAGAPFKTFSEFLEMVHKKGLGVAEMLAMEMKSSGMYVSRGLSYQQAEFMTTEITLTLTQRQNYDVSAALWFEIRKSLKIALSRTSAPSGRTWTVYWAAHQRFFKQLCVGLKVPAVVAEVKAALSAGRCVVIGLQSTGEASMDVDAMKCGNEFGQTKFTSVCREIIKRFINQHFPTCKSGNIGVDILEDDWCVDAKKILLDYADRLDLPNNPLDEMIDELGGVDSVAEMTGRKGRVIRRRADANPVYEERTSLSHSNSIFAMENLNVKERNMFMSGKKLVAIISDAASTGISLHADERVPNRRRRVHITMELPWSADKAVQQLGRSHRSNQCSGPLYKLLTTDLGGERRFAAAVARRLQSLGALTKGDRRAATGADLKEFNFDTPYGHKALKLVYTCICKNVIVPGIQLSKITCNSFTEFNAILQECLVQMGLVDSDVLPGNAYIDDRLQSDVGKFLNRILGLPVERQNLIFTYFTECLEMMIRNAKREGRYDEGLQDIVASSVRVVGKRREVFTNLLNGKTSLVEMEVDRGMDWEHAVIRYENFKSADSSAGFYVSKRYMFGYKMIVLATPKDNSTGGFCISRPSTGLSKLELDQMADLLHKYMPINIEEAKSTWIQSYEASKDRCMHGSHCKHKATCTVGRRCYRLHVLCGNIASLMNVLESVLLRNSPLLGLSKFETCLRVVHVALDSGERVVGVRYPEVLVAEVEHMLKEQKEAEHNECLQKEFTIHQMSTSSSTGSGCQFSLADTQPGLFSQSSVEAITPVNSKQRSKALQPPLTITSFFKPKHVVKDNTISIEHDSGSDAFSKPNSDIVFGIMKEIIHKDSNENNCAQCSVSGNKQEEFVPDESLGNEFNANYGEHVRKAKVESSGSISHQLSVLGSCISCETNFSTCTLHLSTCKPLNSTHSATFTNTSSSSISPASTCKPLNSTHSDTFTNTSSSCSSPASTCKPLNSTHCDTFADTSNSSSSPASSSSQCLPVDGNSDRSTIDQIKFSKQHPQGSTSAVTHHARQLRRGYASKRRAFMRRSKKSLLSASTAGRFNSLSAETKCPVCDKTFHTGTGNEEINNHIDNCMIE